MKLLCLCDSPTLSSGFGRVAQNLFRAWAKRGVTIDCWGIGFIGWGYKKAPYVDTLYPAGGGGAWCSPDNLDFFLRQLSIGGYTHVWIMQDTFNLARNDFPKVLRRLCAERGIRSMLYFPVDAPLDPEWTDIIAAVDVPVAYTRYGAEQARAALARRKSDLARARVASSLNYDADCAVLPHGADLEIYQLMPGREQLRHELYAKSPWLKDDDFVMINVNANQCRKDIPRSLEILALLRARGVPAKLILHMPENGGPHQNISISQCARQLGLAPNVDYGHHGMMFRGSHGLVPESTDYSVKGNASMVGFYNLADLYLTTTKGEGWGLGITESLACGTPVALPDNTACAEIAAAVFESGGMDHMCCLLPLERGASVDRADNSRLRRRVDLPGAADVLEKYYRSDVWRNRRPLGASRQLAHWLDWNRIAGEMLRLFKQPARLNASAPEAPTPANEFIEFGGLEVCEK